jgi:A/G-specific adenine glycosylase
LDVSISDIIKLHRDIGPIPHIFSHINMTYHIQHLRLESTSPPPIPKIDRAVWLDDEGVDHANVGTGVKKVWAEIFGSWGMFEPGAPAKKGKVVKRKIASKEVEPVKSEGKVEAKNGGKVVKKIMMPMMPSRTSNDTK